MKNAAMNIFMHIFLVHQKLFVIGNIPIGVFGRLSDVHKFRISRY